MTTKIIQKLNSRKAKGKKSLALLLDPDKINLDKLDDLLITIAGVKVDFLFIGGSLISSDNMAEIINKLSVLDIPRVIFPGNHAHIHNNADAVLYLSLISGRNADFLIGQHVISAPMLKKSKLEILPTGYILVDGGKPTTVSYISGTNPIPHDKPDVAAATAMAGELLGLQLTYLDCGSGSILSVSEKMIALVSKSVDHPIIVGGGIRDKETALNLFNAGADVIVIGTAFEKDPSILAEIIQARDSINLVCEK